MRYGLSFALSGLRPGACFDPFAAVALDLEGGLTLSDPDTLEALEKKGFALNALFDRNWSREAPP